MTDKPHPRRRPPFRRNERLEALLAELNRELSDGVSGEDQPRSTVLFVVGCPRSGATLLMQWLARSGAFAYPSNFIARFWSNPRVGALVQAMLTDPAYDFRGELAGVHPPELDYVSDLGKTKGLLAPNEFWYFWRRFFPFGDVHRLTADALERVDGGRLEADLQALAAASGKPLVLKAHLLDWHLGYLAETVRGSRFLYLDRDPFFLMQSLLEARRRFFGSVREWYSLKPPEYPALVRLSPYEQVAGQVISIRGAVGRQLDALPPQRWARITYGELCADPAATAERIAELCGQMDRWPDWRIPDPGFRSADTVRMAADEAGRLRETYRRLLAEGPES